MVRISTADIAVWDSTPQRFREPLRPKDLRTDPFGKNGRFARVLPGGNPKP